MLVEDFLKALILIFLFPVFSFSQTNKDTVAFNTDSAAYKFVPATYCWWNESYAKTDSSLNTFQENSDFFRERFPFIINTGNVGSTIGFFQFVSDSAFLTSPRLSRLESNYEIVQLKGMYNQARPYTHAMFVSGPQNEQDILAEYGIQMKKMFRLGAKYVGTGGDGIYTNASTKFSNLDAYAAFTTKNRLYNCSITTQLGKNTVSENGGVKEDTTETYPVRLYYAKNSFSNKGVLLQQQLNWEFDSLMVLNDILKKETRPIPRFEVNHSVAYQTKSYLYSDDFVGDESLYYSSFFMDSTQTRDTTHTSDLTNTLQIYYRKINPNRISGWQVSLGGIHKYLELFQNDSIDTSYTNIGTAISLKRYSLKQSFDLSGTYTISGYNAGDYFTSASYTRFWLDTAKNTTTTVYLNLQVQNNTPSYFYQHYYSNHFRWENQFKDIREIKLNTGMTIDRYKLKIDLTAYNFRNYIYYTINAQPVQAIADLTILTGRLEKKISLYKFHLNSSLLLQKATNISLVHLPLLYVKESFYFETMAFKKALQFQIGLNLNYFTEYYGNYYMPALGQFYLQSETRVGNYPFIDVFAVAKVKKVRLFIKLQHLTSGLIDSSEYMIPYYPVAPRLLKWGVSWIFFD